MMLLEYKLRNKQDDWRDAISFSIDGKPVPREEGLAVKSRLYRDMLPLYRSPKWGPYNFSDDRLTVSVEIVEVVSRSEYYIKTATGDIWRYHYSTNKHNAYYTPATAGQRAEAEAEFARMEAERREYQGRYALPGGRA